MTVHLGPTYIVGVGARTHVGLDALQVTLAGRAEKLRPRESHMVDRHGEPVGTCRLPIISDRLFGVERYAALLRAPLLQAAGPWLNLHGSRAAPALRLVLAVPDPAWRGVDETALHRFADRLVAESLVPLDRSRVIFVREGRAGGVRAVDTAARWCANGEEVVLAAGVDSYFDPEVIDALDQECRLHGLKTENGVIPGEGAGAVLVARSARSVCQPLAKVLACDVQTEPRPWGSEDPCHALGMSVAIKNCCMVSVGTDAHSIPWVMTDVANERHRVNEWQLAFGRHFRAFTQDPVHDQPLLDHGELGAATVPVLAAILCTRWRLGIGEGGLALIAAHSDGSERGALILRECRA